MGNVRRKDYRRCQYRSCEWPAADFIHAGNALISLCPRGLFEGPFQDHANL